MLLATKQNLSDITSYKSLRKCLSPHFLRCAPKSFNSENYSLSFLILVQGNPSPPYPLFGKPHSCSLLHQDSWPLKKTHFSFFILPKLFNSLKGLGSEKHKQRFFDKLFWFQPSLSLPTPAEMKTCFNGGKEKGKALGEKTKSTCISK